ncbi:hypothetical protein CEXT_5411 [Caerostris extrusa]|uniref:Uncharacterized protein n=1 Tax=Caerostris extrusa TaxID=172846 RepID=A0AAV4S6N8_CAEEX|nr:hypothetical protein CEXT_5411 [Caerostris extrusa]
MVDCETSSIPFDVDIDIVFILGALFFSFQLKLGPAYGTESKENRYEAKPHCSSLLAHSKSSQTPLQCK